MACQARSPADAKRTIGRSCARRDAARPAYIGRPARVEAAARLCVSHAAGMRNRSERQTHSDQSAEDEAQDALIVPGVQRKKFSTPTTERASDGMKRSTPGRQTHFQRDEAISPNSPNRCPAGEGPTSNFNRRTEPRTKDQCQLRRFGPRCLRRTNVKLRSGSIPSWETLRSTRATGITHPGFYGGKPWRKPDSTTIIDRSQNPNGRSSESHRPNR